MAPMLFTDAIIRNRPINVFNFGSMSRDFTYIEDIVGGIMKVIEGITNQQNQVSDRNNFRVYNIGNSAPTKLLDFIKTLEITLGKNAILNMMPIQPGDVESTYADISDLVIDFNYKPSTSIQYGVEQFVKWYKEYYKGYTL